MVDSQYQKLNQTNFDNSIEEYDDSMDFRLQNVSDLIQNFKVQSNFTMLAKTLSNLDVLVLRHYGIE